MKMLKLNYSIITTVILLLSAVGCSDRNVNELANSASYPTTPEVFIDGFSAGLNYSAWGKVTNFQVDYSTVYRGSASMRFDVPNAGDPFGSTAGGVFQTSLPRNLSGYTALTFWAKATETDTLSSIGFGESNVNGADVASHKVTLNKLVLTTTWTKYYMPIPDPSKLTAETGMFWYWIDPRNGGKGFTFWIDEMKFENIGTITNPSGVMFSGKDMVFNNIENGTYSIPDVTGSFNLPDGINQSESFAPGYLTLTSTNPGVANVNTPGKYTVTGSGSTLITARLNGAHVQGSALVISIGPPVLPSNALTPNTTQYPASTVKSIYSDTYPNVTVDSYEPFWTWSGGGMTTNYSIYSINGNHVIRYTNFNDTYHQNGVLVAISFETVPVDISAMTTFHMDVFVPANSPNATNKLTISLEDWSGNYGGVSSMGSYKSSSALATGSWVSLEIPLSAFTGLNGKSHLVHIILNNFPTVTFVDNVFFHK